MKNLTILKPSVYCVFFMFFMVSIYAQESKTKLNQDLKFEQLLNEKRKINQSITLNNRFKIQIFTGDSETSKKALVDFKKNNKNIDGTIVFHTPIYKVWIGNFKTRIDAERKLKELSKKFPNAFIVKPNK